MTMKALEKRLAKIVSNICSVHLQKSVGKTILRVLRVLKHKKNQ